MCFKVSRCFNINVYSGGYELSAFVNVSERSRIELVFVGFVSEKASNSLALLYILNLIFGLIFLKFQKKKEYEFKTEAVKLENLTKTKIESTEINPKWKLALFLVCLSCFIENFVITGTSAVVLSSIEKEFFLTNLQGGLFLGVYELGGLSAPIFGYFGSSNRINKMRQISLSLLLVTLGSFIIGFTIFIKPAYNFTFNPDSILLNQTNYSEICPSNSSVDPICSGISNSIKNQLSFMIYIGHLIIGFGGVAIYSVGIDYVENISPKVRSALCQAIFYATGALGGGIGFLCTGQFLNLNARFYSSSYEPNKWIKPTSTFWIGAWWLPYLVYGTMCAILCVITFISSYASFTHTNQSTVTKPVESQTANEIETNFKKKFKKFLETLNKSAKEFLKKIKITLRNFVLVFIILSTVTEGIILKGFLGFMTLFIQFQFSMDPSTSSILTGALALVSIIFGTLISAVIINKFKWQLKQTAIFTTVLFFITSFVFLIMLNYCPEKEFTGNSCGGKCNCDEKFHPICSSQNSSYIFQSPCHAGCQRQISSTDYTDCLCTDSTISSFTPTNITYSGSFCPTKIKCIDKLIVNGIGAFIIVFLTAMSIVPHIKSVVGCVEEEFLSFSLGVRAATVSLFGNFAGTLIVGQAVDLSCKFWLKNCFGQKVCEIYNNFEMSKAMGSVGFGCRFLSFLFMLVSVIIIIRKERKQQPMSHKNELAINETNDSKF